MRVDLHLHTTASDGRLSPAEVVQLAVKLGLSIIAITDHDTTDGIEPALAAARSFPSLKVIPGVEIGTDIPHGEVHVLGYFIDYAQLELQRTLERLRNSRQDRARRMIAKLEKLGIRIEWSRVQELAGGGSIGRPHIAQAMFERGYIPSIREAFIKYIGREGPAYAEREKMTPAEAVELVISCGGLPVLAHPADIDDLEGFLAQLVAAGLVGIEAYYDGYARETIRWLVSLADKHGLIPCGGSDYHGLDSNAETPPGGVDIPLESARRLIAQSGEKSQELMVP